MGRGSVAGLPAGPTARLSRLVAQLLVPPPPPPPSRASTPVTRCCSADHLEDRIAPVFADLDRPDSAGCAYAVVQDGELIATGGYGSAQLEHGVAIDPAETIFHVASVSKQFTAFAVTVLEHEQPAALSLDDPIGRHLPFVDPELGRRVTIRQMIYHTSGLRDQWELLNLAGWRMDDVITTSDILGLMGRQRELNFTPGSLYVYCNMAYTLLAQVVEAVAGVPFPLWCSRRIFEPLGMTKTHFHDDHRLIVPNRAESYSTAPAAAAKPGMTKETLSYANCGATSLFTTATDLCKWLDNFRTQAVGGEVVMAKMVKEGTLNDGSGIGYAHGLDIGSHRGCPWVGHSGADAGFRSQVVYFPEQNLGVVVLSNLASEDPGRRAIAVAEAVVEASGRSFREPPAARASVMAPSPPGRPAVTHDAGRERAEQLSGQYYSAELETTLTVAGPGGRGGMGSKLWLNHHKHGSCALLATHTVGDGFVTGKRSPLQSLAVRFVRESGGPVLGLRLSGDYGTGRVRELWFGRLDRAALLPGYPTEMYYG